MARQLPSRPFLYPVLDVGLLAGRSLGAAVASLAAGGARLVQLRAKGVPDRSLLDLSREAVAAAHAAGALLIVNDRPDVGRIVSADGVHVGQEDLTPADVRALMPDALVGVSTHNLEQLRIAATAPVDYVAVGPVFPTTTKQRPDPVVGLDLIRRARSATSLPLVAIGGITLANVREVLRAGADGVAVASGVLTAADLPAAVEAFQQALQEQQ